ncbi:MAG: exodeoxyribonuclease VII large subunit [Clostridiales bacterium]|nr:exodeoxyribonuclease VII large subunit [Clostridiales bacterium]
METVKVGPVTVSQLNDYLKQKLEADEALRMVCVEGEISNFTAHTSGHLYFSLKDKDASIKAVMFRGYRQRLTFLPKNGMKVVVVGDISFYPKAGAVQLYAQHMFPSGVGEVYTDFEALKAKLSAEGLFDAAHKKSIPKYPEKIGIITSPTGAAIQDIRNVLRRRYPLALQRFCPVTVQGSAAPMEMIHALQQLNEEGECDVILLARGGGSGEDLFVFNDEGLARAIYASEIPVITGIGHEIDYTIADFVADLRAPTPSAAAELAVPDQKDLLLLLDHLGESLKSLMLEKIRTAQDTIGNLEIRNDQQFRLQIERAEQIAASLSGLLQQQMKVLLQNKRADLEKGAVYLAARNPLSRFGGGFVYAEVNGVPLEKIDQLQIGQQLLIQAKDGRAFAQVQGIEREQNNEI